MQTRQSTLLFFLGYCSEEDGKEMWEGHYYEYMQHHCFRGPLLYCPSVVDINKCILLKRKSDAFTPCSRLFRPRSKHRWRIRPPVSSSSDGLLLCHVVKSHTNLLAHTAFSTVHILFLTKLSRNEMKTSNANILERNISK